MDPLLAGKYFTAISYLSTHPIVRAKLVGGGVRKPNFRVPEGAAEFRHIFGGTASAGVAPAVRRSKSSNLPKRFEKTAPMAPKWDATHFGNPPRRNAEFSRAALFNNAALSSYTGSNRN